MPGPRSPTWRRSSPTPPPQVAKVQAELSHARAADPNPPDVPVPYAGHAPVVMINGQQVPAGQAVDISAMLGGFFGGADAAAVDRPRRAPQIINIPPVVTVNGQVCQRRPARRPVVGDRPRGAGPGPQLAGAARAGRSVRGAVRLAACRRPQPADRPGPRPARRRHAMPYSTTPGEVTGSGNKALVWLAALLVVGLIGVIAYLMLTG